ncbi:hyaluronate lyase, putative [Babesia ovis]|uniref:Hyaluronate lyase, putative n=1 Tax=Babesia ovis TaxID=5869 RepID=A0A9W5WUE2_BABOV|nr:hyaluronate lyase, putative [Babesia ovis]
MASFGGFSKLATMLCFCLVALSAYLISSTVAVTIEVDKDTNKLVLTTEGENALARKLYDLKGRLEHVDSLFSEFLLDFQHLSNYQGTDPDKNKDRNTYMRLMKQVESITDEAATYKPLMSFLKQYKQLESTLGEDEVDVEAGTDNQTRITNIVEDFNNTGFVIDESHLNRFIHDIDVFIYECNSFVFKPLEALYKKQRELRKLKPKGDSECDSDSKLESEGEEKDTSAESGNKTTEFAEHIDKQGSVASTGVYENRNIDHVQDGATGCSSSTETPDIDLLKSYIRVKGMLNDVRLYVMLIALYSHGWEYDKEKNDSQYVKHKQRVEELRTNALDVVWTLGIYEYIHATLDFYNHYKAISPLYGDLRNEAASEECASKLKKWLMERGFIGLLNETSEFHGLCSSILKSYEELNDEADKIYYCGERMNYLTSGQKDSTEADVAPTEVEPTTPEQNTDEAAPALEGVDEVDCAPTSGNIRSVP